ncbi:YfiR family protein [Neorhodopirellula lusitana]|uniref:YfiR family protein n=1 Tax=Neorhodopirellula lusitana TaxID=445327 RepID=UPI00384F160B
MRRRFTMGRCLLGALAVLLASAIPVHSQDYVSANTTAARSQGSSAVQTAKESNIKAVYLYSFGRFTTWPSKLTQPSDRFTIGVVGSTDVRASLNKIASKRKIQDIPIEVKFYESGSDIAVDDCQILYITGMVLPQDTAALITKLSGSPTLIVTETFDRPQGTVVNFTHEGNGIQFEIDLDEAKRKQLALDARLLRQGKRMIRNHSPQGL